MSEKNGASVIQKSQNIALNCFYLLGFHVIANSTANTSMQLTLSYEVHILLSLKVKLFYSVKICKPTFCIHHFNSIFITELQVRRLCWYLNSSNEVKVPYDGVPFSYAGKLVMRCHHGPDKCKKQKVKYKEMRIKEEVRSLLYQSELIDIL